VKRVVVAFGTRPEAIKLAPILKALEASERLQAITCVTAQHREMLDQALAAFEITPDYDLDLMIKGQTLEYLTARILEKFAPVLAEVEPDCVIVQGDTTSSFVCALAAFYKQIPVGHVEAGLRTPERYNPFPEEMNRRLTGRLASLHFAPTEWAKGNLLKEGVSEKDIFVTGNPVVDALQEIAGRPRKLESAEVERALEAADKRRILLVTLHRRENLGAPMREICRAIRRLLDEFEDLHLIFPMHLNPKVREVVKTELGDHKRASLIEPPDYLDFVQLLKRAYLVLTDSGGVQEEAPGLGKAVLVARTTTERPEGVEAGVAKLVGHSGEQVFSEAKRLLEDEATYRAMTRRVSPYGDGKASRRVVQALEHFLFGDVARPEDFKAS